VDAGGPIGGDHDYVVRVAYNNSTYENHLAISAVNLRLKDRPALSIGDDLLGVIQHGFQLSQ